MMTQLMHINPYKCIHHDRGVKKSRNTDSTTNTNINTNFKQYLCKIPSQGLFTLV